MAILDWAMEAAFNWFMSWVVFAGLFAVILGGSEVTRWTGERPPPICESDMMCSEDKPLEPWWEPPIGFPVPSVVRAYPNAIIMATALADARDTRPCMTMGEAQSPRRQQADMLLGRLYLKAPYQ
jgi:hypothetical protein